MNSFVIDNCPICASKDIESRFDEMYDDRYGYPGKFSLSKCKACDHSFLNARFSDIQLTELYSNFYPRSTFDSKKHRPHIERHGFMAWLNGVCASAYRWVPKDCTVLDIGCGFGETLGYHKKRGCDVYGVEVDENISRVAQKFGYKVHVGLFKPEMYPEAFFDYVTMDQVFEHAQNPIQMLKGIVKVLKPGGKVIMSMPNGRGWGARFFGHRWINWHVPYHMQFYSIPSINLALENVGLVLEKTTTITSSAWLYYQWLHLLTYPSEGVASKFWTQSGEYTSRQKLAMKCLAILNRFRVNHVITRAFDTLGLGDNRLFFLIKP